LVVSLWNKKYSHNYHWIYDPDLEKEYHREFFISNYSIFSKKNVLYTETNKKRWPGKNIKWKNGKRPVFEYINKVAYPIPLIGNTTAINCILEYYKKFSLFGVGRWGQWKYYNADACILEAMILSDSILGKIK